MGEGDHTSGQYGAVQSSREARRWTAELSVLHDFTVVFTTDFCGWTLHWPEQQKHDAATSQLRAEVAAHHHRALLEHISEALACVSAISFAASAAG
jgi:hypothetical protein